MPYYVYKIFPMRVLQKVGEFAKFNEASAQAKTLRLEIAPTDRYTIKVIFGENELAAEDMLGQVRIAPPKVGDDY